MHVVKNIQNHEHQQEKYGNLKRFKFLIDLYPLQFKKLSPNNKYITQNNNPPNFSVEFFIDQKNLNNINCFSNEGGKWEKSNVILKNNILIIKFKDKFIDRRGRINCSLKDNGKCKWFGTQYIIGTN